jgi:taurine transport system substrate-binding protein
MALVRPQVSARIFALEISMTSIFQRIGAAVIAAATLAMAAPATTQTKQAVIAYQTGVDPAKLAQAEGTYEKSTGYAIDWRKFDSGADVIAAIASGAVQIGYVGSSPLAAAVSRQLPIQTIFVAALLGDAEALVVRNGSGIEKPQDLVGKKVAVPFVSTTPLQLAGSTQALEHRS